MYKNLNLFGRVTFLFLLCWTLKFSSADARNVESVTITPESAELEIGETLQLSLSIRPADANAHIEWFSGDPSIADVNTTGMVTALKLGLAVIYARDTDGATGFATIKVKDNTVISINVIPEELILDLGETARLQTQINPPGAQSQISWSSRDSTIATVDGQGLVTAVGKGTTFIIAKSENGAAGVATVTVIDSNEIISISVLPENLELVVGEETQLELIMQPSSSTQEIKWLSSDPSVAEVNENGVVTAVNPGVAVIYAVSENGLTGFSTVKVISKEIMSITIEPDNLTLELDETARLTLIIEPSIAEGEITWISTDTTVATVDNDGVVTAGEPGFTFIYAMSENGVTGLSIVKVVDPGAEGYDPDHGYGENGAYVSVVRIREGDNIGLFAERPAGFGNNEWTYQWYLNDELEAEGKYTLVTAGDDSGWKGNVKEISSLNYQVDILNTVGDEVILNLPQVSVYSRPLTPVELFKKGDGATHSLIAMSQFTDAELERLGYSFVFGYTDADGVNHVISNSTLRYCYTTNEIYNNNSYRLWVYTTWTFPDGANITSGLRYLDGSLNERFDRSDFNITRVSASIESLSEENGAGIYTLNGLPLGKDLSRLAPGIYIVKEINGNMINTRKIIIK